MFHKDFGEILAPVRSNFEEYPSLNSQARIIDLECTMDSLSPSQLLLKRTPGRLPEQPLERQITLVTPQLFRCVCYVIILDEVRLEPGVTDMLPNMPQVSCTECSKV
ncbi:uncharacterized protein [Macrobrachium rosenbergii]|uniref:uncharacterized protein n=1 Tax=Macrobrachium rosenbergii TaxID=79674 RepID=UPI0034D76406